MFLILLLFSFAFSFCHADDSSAPHEEIATECRNKNEASDDQIDTICSLFDEFFVLSTKIKTYTPKVFMDTYRNSFLTDELLQLIDALYPELTHLQTIILKYYPALTERCAELISRAEDLKKELT